MSFMNTHIKKEGNTNPSKAPYNFVPLNGSRFGLIHEPDFDKYTGYSGFIEVTAKTLTDFYIRDGLTPDEYKEQGKMNNKEKNENQKATFWSQGVRFRIPGSSTRGMIKTLVEIITFGSFTQFEQNKRLFFRSIIRGSGLTASYAEYGLTRSENRTTNYLAKGGLLIYNNGRYSIQPCNTERVENDLMSLLNLDTSSPYLSGKYKFHYNTTMEEYYLDLDTLVPGRPEGYRHKLWKFSKDLTKPSIPLTSNDIKFHQLDKLRGAAEMLKESEKSSSTFPEGIPVFYHTVEISINEKIENITIFGSTAMLRMPYKSTLKDHVPENLLNESNQANGNQQSENDIAENLFGKFGNWRSRVRVEDFFHEPNRDNPDIYYTKPQTAKRLESPKPTAVQHYLTQDSNLAGAIWNYNAKPEDNEKYSQLRGYKLYPHKSDSIANWKNPTGNGNTTEENGDTNHPKIQPIKKDQNFVGKIWFDNLSDIELGALLSVLDLPEGHAHKLGMGKPIGLGSIQLTSELTILVDATTKESKEADIFYLGKQNEQKKLTILDYRTAYLNWINSKLFGAKEEKFKSDIWSIWRLNELKKMLDFKGKPKDNLTEYMELTEFGGKKDGSNVTPGILPKATDI